VTSAEAFAQLRARRGLQQWNSLSFCQNLHCLIIQHQWLLPAKHQRKNRRRNHWQLRRCHQWLKSFPWKRQLP